MKDEPIDEPIKDEPGGVIDDDTPMDDIPEYVPPPTADPATGGSGTGGTAPVVVPPSMPDLIDDFVRISRDRIATYNSKSWWNINGSKPTYGGATVVVADLFEDICPDRYSFRQSSRANALAITGGSGAFGEITSASHYGWWSTNFDHAFTEETYGTYISKAAVTGQSGLTIAGVGCHEPGGAFGGSPSVLLKWATDYGVLPTTPYMQFSSVTESGQTGVFNYSIDVPMLNGQVDVPMLNHDIAKVVPQNGCFFVMDLRLKKVYFHIMDGAKVTENGNVPRDGEFVADTEPKYTGKLEGLPAFSWSSPEPHGRKYVGPGFTVDTSVASKDLQRVWPQAFAGLNQAGMIGDYTEHRSLAEAQARRPITLMEDTGNFYAFSRVTHWRPGDSCRTYSAYLRPGKSTQLVGWLVRWYQSDQPRRIVTGYGWTSDAPVANSGMSGNGSTYDLTTPNVQQEIQDVMLLPGGADTLGFVYDASIGQYGRVTWISQI